MDEQFIQQKSPRFKLKDMNGEYVTLDQLKGKIVALDFGATWCEPLFKSFSSDVSIKREV